LDVSRHFFPASFVKKYIDYLAFHKMNTFHWHLTDDQGWRIEIKSYPKLTEVGAWRDSTLIGHTRATPVRFDGVRYGGYYTQDEVKDIIHYAAVRGITIIPEVDIPGHSRAAIASYPELSTDPDSSWKVATIWATFNRHNNVLAPNEKTFAFLKAVFGEIADLFPSPYIHVGGDECSKTWWKADPQTQSFMKQHGLKDETELQTYFIQQVIGYLKAKGKKVIGWDEILEPGLDTSAIIMNWRGVKAAITAAENGHEVIMVPGKPLYFDFYQSKERDSLAIGGYNPLDSVYLFEPIPVQIAAKGLSNQVLGAQANVWAEYIAYPSKVEYMIFPRMTALSEVLWTDKNKKDIVDFKRRLEVTAVPRYRFWNSSYYKNFAAGAMP
jgi:hexosaminidase